MPEASLSASACASSGFALRMQMAAPRLSRASRAQLDAAAPHRSAQDGFEVLVLIPVELPARSPLASIAEVARQIPFHSAFREPVMVPPRNGRHDASSVCFARRRPGHSCHAPFAGRITIFPPCRPTSTNEPCLASWRTSRTSSGSRVTARLPPVRMSLRPRSFSMPKRPTSRARPCSLSASSGRSVS